MSTVEGYATERLRQRMADIATDLERLATRVRSAIDDIDQVGTPGCENYGHVAGQVQHAVITAIPNLGLNDLTRHAAEADIARAKGE